MPPPMKNTRCPRCLAPSSSPCVMGFGSWAQTGWWRRWHAYFGVATFLRQSNFIPTTPGDGRHLLTRGDVQVDAAGLRVHVRTTKTLSPRSGGVVLPVARVPGSRYCPVESCTHALGLVTGAPGGLLFLLPSTGGPLTVTAMTMACRRVLRAARWPMANAFTLHSLRRTGARLAPEGGSDLPDFMLHGTWTSSGVRSYVPTHLALSVPVTIATVLGEDETR